jgi:hypothetical protein
MEKVCVSFANVFDMVVTKDDATLLFLEDDYIF